MRREVDDAVDELEAVTDGVRRELRRQTNWRGERRSMPPSRPSAKKVRRSTEMARFSAQP
jgi:hypothetical protein